MTKSPEKPPPGSGQRPEWASVKYFQCSLLASHVLLSAPRESADGDEEILAAFFYYVPAPEGGQNLGVMLVSASLTLYLVMHGMPQAFSTLAQVCLPHGGFAEVSASGFGGSVLWSDMSLQRILRYDCMKTDGDELHKLRYARFVHYLSKPSFKELPAAEQEEGKRSAIGALGAIGGEEGGQPRSAISTISGVGAVSGEVQSAGGLVPNGSIARSAGFMGDSGGGSSLVREFISAGVGGEGGRRSEDGGQSRSAIGAIGAVSGGVVYLVGDTFRVEGECSRVVTLGKRNDVWEVPPFIRMVLKVLLTDAREGGLTSEVIHETATQMYLEKYPEVKNNKGMKGSGVLARKALGQHFRYTDKNGNKIDHPLFQMVTKFGTKVPTYCLKKESVKILKGPQASLD